MAQCLLLGGNGFIGRNLALALANAGYSVLSADIKHDGEFHHPFITYRTGDLAQTHFVDDCLKQGPFEFVFLLACTLIPSSGEVEFLNEQNFQRNLGFVLPGRMQEFGSKTLVYFSSGGAVYGRNGFNLNHEGAPLYPINHYGQAKKILEEAIQKQTNKVDYLILRPSNPYGYGQKINAAQGLIAVTFGKVMRGEPIEIWGDGCVVRDYLHISDLISAVIELMSRNTRNEIYNIGSGEGKSVNQVLEVIQSIFNQKLDIRYGEGRTVDINSSVLDISKITTSTGWSPKVSLEQGISEFWLQIQKIAT